MKKQIFYDIYLYLIKNVIFLIINKKMKVTVVNNL